MDGQRGVRDVKRENLVWYTMGRIHLTTIPLVATEWKPYSLNQIREDFVSIKQQIG